MPLPHTDVTVTQLRHEFGFGNIGFDFVPLANGEQPELQPLADLWLEVFNVATLPFYWADFEREQGHPATARLAATARWFGDRGVPVKGHPLVWHTLAPQWLRGDVQRQVRERVRREVTAFRGLVAQWDVINETVIMPVFDNGDNAITPLAVQLGRQGMIRLAFEEARAADSGAVLLINDFDLGVEYERVIEDALAAGIPIDAIGLQTHMHQGFRGEEQLVEVADRFARFGLPLHFTETTLLSGDLMPAEIVDLNDYVVESWPSTPEGEARQADEVERHYRALVGHPAVASITYWGFTDAGAWLGAPAGLVRADGTPKPAYTRLKSLVKGEWWMPPTTLRTDADGVLGIEGFRGYYEIAVGGQRSEVTVGAAGIVRSAR